MSNVLVLMALTMTIFSLLGMQLFGGKYPEAVGYGPPPLKPLPRSHFDYFGPAMITVFIAMTGNWYAARPAPRHSHLHSQAIALLPVATHDPTHATGM